MKKKIVLVITGVILLISVVGFMVFLKKDNAVTLKESNFIFEYGDKVPFEVGYYVKSTEEDIIEKAEIKFQDDIVEIKDDEMKSIDSDYLEVGKYELNIEYENKQYDFTIEVKDTTKPEFVTFQEEIIMEQNALDVDLKKFYEATDLSGTTIEIESEFDVTKVGEYKAIVKAIDTYENINQQETIIKVIPYDDIEKYEITKTIDGTEYKSQKRIDKENKKEDTTSNQQANTSSKKPTTSNNNSGSSKKEPTTTTPAATYRKDISDSYVKQINEYRIANGRTELPVTSEAQAVADQRAKEIVTDFSHDGAVYAFGENIGKGGIGTDFVALWKNSFGHNNTLLREQNTCMAVSVYQVDGMWYAVAVFRLDY